MIVFGIKYNFFIGLPIQLKTCRFNDFFLFYEVKFVRPKHSARLRSFARPSNLSRPDIMSQNVCPIFKLGVIDMRIYLLVNLIFAYYKSDIEFKNILRNFVSLT